MAMSICKKTPYNKQDMYLWNLLVIVACGSMLSGCSDYGGRQSISGRVLLDGEPLARGTISFQPAADGSGFGAGGSITDGSFEIPADHGLLPGTYNVTITAYQPTGRKIQDPQRGLVEELRRVRFRDLPPPATVTLDGKNRLEISLTTADDPRQ